MSPGEVIIHRVDLSAAGANHLSDSERGRAARFHHETDRRRWSAARSALREILGLGLGHAPALVELEAGDHGKPVLRAPHDRIHFNLSHCEDLMLVALSIDGPVGIDVEPLARAVDLSGCEESFCHPDEIAALPTDHPARDHRLLRIWTAKEALLKAAGCGLLQPPETVRLEVGNPVVAWSSDPPIQGIDGWQLHALDVDSLAGYLACVCIPPGSRVVFSGAHS